MWQNKLHFTVGWETIIVLKTNSERRKGLFKDIRHDSYRGWGIVQLCCLRWNDPM